MKNTSTKIYFSKPAYFQWLDAARGLAAIAVLVWHYQHFFLPLQLDSSTRSVQPLYSILKMFYIYGALAVQFFWVISGFVFAHVYLNKKIGTYAFFIRRFSRLYPLHFFTLNIVLILQIISFKFFNEYQIYPMNDLYHYILNLFFASYWGLEKGFSFNAPIWSVSVEILIYAFFWITLILFRKLYFYLVFFFIALFFATWKANLYAPIAECGFYFFSGCLTFYSWNFFVTQTRRSLCFATSLFILIPSAVFFVDQSHLIIILKLLFFPVLTFSLATLDSMSSFKNIKTLRKLGDITYSLYLLHVPIQISLLLGIKALRLNTSLYYTPSFLIFYMALCISAALWTHKYIEMTVKNFIIKKMIAKNKS